MVVTAFVVLMFASAHAEGRLPGTFVYLRDIDAGIRQDMRYAGANNFTGRPLPGYAAECILKRPVALALKRAQAELAASNLALKVYDCYRPARAVAAMARWSRDPNAAPDTARFYPDLDKSRLFALGYIAEFSAHSRGVAVDLTIVARDAPPPAPFDANARYGSCAGPAAQRAPDDALDMGTGFDCFNDKSATRTAAVSKDAQERRQILVTAMNRHGFVNYKREWWHFSFPAADDGVTHDFPIPPR